MSQADADNAPRTVAVLVAHGMGQQAPYQTLEQVVEGLRLVERAEGRAPPAPGATLVRVDDEKRTVRAEMTLDGPRGPTRVHVYEAYWAPITEGKVTLKDVTAFIMAGAWNGLGTTLRPALANVFRVRLGMERRPGFTRWLFGARHEYPLGWKTTGYLLVALMVVLALAAMNAVAAALVTLQGARLVMKEPPAWVEGALQDLTYATIAFLVPAVLLVVLLGVGGWVKRRRHARAQAPSTPGETRSARERLAAVRAPRWVARAAMFALVCAVVLAVAFNVVLVAAIAGSAARALLPGVPDASVVGMLRLDPLPLGAVLVTWGFVIYVSRKVSGFLVQYVGDVAAYVSPHELDRFMDLRNQVKACIRQVAEAVYDAPERYEEVYVVGHSLGSVAVYDALNALVGEDLLAARAGGASRRVRERTRLLLTFGSPLDKTAFFFGIHRSGDLVMRMQAEHQPLITAYANRPFPWVNVHAPGDFISGKLDFYDPPTGGANRVDNRADPQALLPLASHNEYWDDVFLWDVLHGRITGAPTAISATP